MKNLLWYLASISLILGVSACSKPEMQMVLEDISRDTYEKNAKASRIEKIFDTPQAEDEPLTYDRYMREREELISGHEKAPEATQ